MEYPISNLILDHLPHPMRAELIEQLEPVPMPLGQELYRSMEAPRFAHFLTSGMASVVAETSEGDGVEVALTGREGLPEALHVIGPQRGQMRCFMQVEGTALRMEFRRFEQEFQRIPALHNLVLRHVQYGTLVTSQIAACNRVHTLEERLARWLLMVSERIGSLELHLTQEFLGEMLGTRRSTVTLAAGALQRSGLIEYRRGHIRILERDSLQDAACECFSITHRMFEDLHR